MDSAAPSFKDVLSRLEHRMRRRKFAPRSVIVRQGSTDHSAFLVLSGRVAVRRKDPDSGIELLLAELAEINDPGVNISTAEDPIEYDLPGVTQIQVNSAIGLTFASVLRAFLLTEGLTTVEEVTSVVSVDI